MKPASEPVVLQLIRTAERSGNSYLDLLKSYLAADPTGFPDYSGQTGSVYKRDNTDKKTFWV